MTIRVFLIVQIGEHNGTLYQDFEDAQLAAERAGTAASNFDDYRFGLHGYTRQIERLIRDGWRFGGDLMDAADYSVYVHYFHDPRDNDYHSVTTHSDESGGTDYIRMANCRDWFDDEWELLDKSTFADFVGTVQKACFDAAAA